MERQFDREADKLGGMNGISKIIFYRVISLA